MSLDGAFRVLVAELASVGVDPNAVCAAAKIPLSTRDDAAPIGWEAIARVLERAEAMAGDPLLGLHMAERAQGRGLLSYLARSQDTVGGGLEAFACFSTAAWGAPVVGTERRGAETVVTFQLHAALPRHAAEYLVARTAIALRRSGAAPRAAAFAHDAGGDSTEYQRVLRCPVRFRAGETSLRLRTTELARPLRAANPEAAAAIAAALTRPAMPTLPATTARLAAAVEDTIARGARPDREALARALGMSGRTLARRLALEQRRFRDVVDGVRRALAHRLLVKESVGVGEVAQRVGFADPAALGKAFRRWFGQSPSSFRSRRSPGAHRATAG